MRRLAALLAVAAVAALWAGSARASLFLVFSTTEALPGTMVAVRTGGEGALSTLADAPPLRVFLAPADAADEITSVDDGRLVLLGRLRVDAGGNGRLRFVVPDVPAGEYATLTHCVPCAASSAGRELLPTGPFRGPFIVLGSETGSRFPLLAVALGAGGGGFVLLLGIGWVLRRRRLV